MSIPAKPINWTSFDASAIPIDVATDIAPPAASALLAAVDAVVQAVAVTPYVGTGHLCFRHGYAGGAATSATKLHYTMSIAPGAVHGKLATTDRMVASAIVTPNYHEAWTLTGGSAGANVAQLPMYVPPNTLQGNFPSFWSGKQYPVESSETVDDTPVASSNRLLELPSFRHPVKESAFVSAVMAWSCRVTHITSDLASL